MTEEGTVQIPMGATVAIEGLIIRKNGTIVQLGTLSDERHGPLRRRLNNLRVYLVQKPALAWLARIL